MSEQPPVDKSTIQKIVTGLQPGAAEPELTPENRVQRALDTKQAQRELGQLADAAAKQEGQVLAGQAAKEDVNATIDAALAAKGLKPLSSSVSQETGQK